MRDVGAKTRRTSSATSLKSLEDICPSRIATNVRLGARRLAVATTVSNDSAQTSGSVTLVRPCGRSKPRPPSEIALLSMPQSVTPPTL
jgi:hypothetical protein